MMQHRTTRPAASAAVLLAAAGLALAGCGNSAGASGTASSPAAGGSSSASSSGSASSGASSVASSGGSSASVGTAYFPAAAGNTWVYDLSNSSEHHATVTNKMTKVTPRAGGQQVTMAVSDSAVGGGTPTYVSYVFHPDGSISFPLNNLGGALIKIKSGSILWPSAAQLSSGRPIASTIVFTVTVAGHANQAKADSTVQGRGSQSVTVPAGTYQARVIDETISEKFSGVAISFTTRTWVVTGVGPVKSETFNTTSTAGTPTTVEVLKSFTKG